MQAKQSIKQRLRSREPLLGFFIGLPSPALVEMIAWAGFDFVIIDSEHGPIGVETIEHMVRTAQGAGMAALVRLPHAHNITRILDLGADGIVVPHVSTAAEAAAVVDASFFPPLGHRGVTTLSRAARYGFEPTAQFLAGRNDETAVVVIIEDVAAIPEVPAIARMPGIDGIFVGPSDLSASLGHAGQPGHPEVVAAIATIRDAVLANGSAGLGTTGRAPADVAGTIAAGFNFIGFSTPLVFANALRELMRAVKPG